MDEFETSSNTSDCPSLNLSSVSGLTGFEDEFGNLKSIVREPAYLLQDVACLANGNGTFNDLETALQLNEQYRKDFNTLETKLELLNREKFQQLHNRVVQLETQLTLANSQLATYKRINSEDCNISSQLRNEVEQLELLNNNLKLNLEEQKIDFDTKCTSVTALKQKIVDLHVELQVSTQSNIKLNNDLRILRNDLTSSKKSQLWYKDCLHKCRSEKVELSEEISQLHSLLISKERELNARNAEYLAVSGMLENVQAAYSQFSKVSYDSDVENYKTTISNLNLELTNLKQAVQSQREAFEDTAKQNAKLITTNGELLHCLSQKDVNLLNLESDKKDLLVNVDILESKLANFNDLMRDITDSKLQVEIALEAAKHEKADVEDAVKEIRDNFSKFAERFRQIQGKLFKANRLIRELEEARISVENDNKKLRVEIEECSKNCNYQVAGIKKTLDGEIERSTSLAKELHLLAESNIECELKRKLLEYQVRKFKDKRGQSSELTNIKNRLIQIESRFGQVKSRAKADQEEITSLKILLYENGSKSNSVNENIRNLKALCKAKELELKEKEKRFQSNYRTLLRKVKEHMRGRNTAEKHCKYLQELYDNLSEELNTSKLQKAMQAVDLQNLNSEYDNFKNNNVKIKRDLCRLQQECITLKEEVAKHKEEARKLESSFKINNMQFEEQNHNLSKKLADMQAEYSKLESELSLTVNAKENLHTQLLQEQERSAEFTSLLHGTETELQQIKVEKEMLCDEVENLKMKLSCNMNELTELREQKIFLDTKRKLEEILVNNLKSDIQVLENDLNAVRSDKYFLQRLCNDLKSALTTSKIQNENLKQQMTSLSPDVSLSIPSPCKYDDEFINDLLKRSLTPLSEKPLYELHNNLNLLKKEMLALQKQVIVTCENGI